MDGRMKEKLEDWIKLLTYVFEPRTIEIREEDEGDFRIDMDEFSIYPPRVDNKIYVEIWQHSYGSYDTPPDVFESAFGTYDRISEVVRAIWMYNSQTILANKLESYYDLQFSQDCGIM